MKQFFVYIMGSRSGVLYIGVTSDLQKRIYQHREGMVEGFTRRYQVKQLLYWEEAPDAEAAISREKQLKKWRREKKLNLIKTLNPELLDLSVGIGLE